MENKQLLMILRAAFITCVYFLTLACYLAPIIIAKHWKSKSLSLSSPSQVFESRRYVNRIISWCNCTSIGIFLSMCFLAIFPTVKEMIHKICENSDYKTNFPITEFLVVVGFILTLLMEQSILLCQERAESSLRDIAEQNEGLLEMQDFNDEPNYIQNEQEQGLVSSFQTKAKGYTDEELNTDDCSTHVLHGHSHISLLSHRGDNFSFVLLFIATGLHSLFEGITLGLQSNTSKAVHLFVAIIIHECLVSLALGISSTKMQYSFSSYLKFAFFFSAVIPVGVVIGIVVQHAPGIGGEIVSAILQSLSAGVFLHVSFQDFLPREFSNQQDRITKVCFVTLGFVVIAILTFVLS
ncbi:hypothetical protein JTE90_029475 [Oedothorax gibbosus]|uniref:Zinc transporter ZIP3 n=1 Tax=Oedothorax gibbosus TaxID=931172 RepID=A0AAV6V3P7_9ARAC|nr:hypothetical protein JTE90_029475 [Oedothorax gibbosus]